MEYMIVYPLPENYKETPNNIQRIMEKFKSSVKHLSSLLKNISWTMYSIFI